MKARIESEEKELNDLKEKLTKLQDENQKSQLSAKITDEEVEKDKLQNQLKEVKKLETELKRTIEERNQLQNELNSIEKNIPQLNEILKNRNDEKKNLDECLTRLQNE